MIAGGKHNDQRNKRRRKAFSWLMVLCMIMSMFIPQFASAAAGDEPDHDKILTQNDDGTYTIALNVTGDSEKQIQKVNVIVIVDRSGSMNSQSGTGAYVPTNGTGNGLYGLIDGEYVPLTRQGGPGNRTFWYNGVQYTGQRYQYDATATRLQATQAAVTNLAGTLLGYNGSNGNPSDTVEMALVTFATSSQTNVAKTTSADTYNAAVAGITVATGNAAGTNWEAALKQADTIDFGDDDPTYVIFFSDGSPTFYLNAQGGTAGTGQEQEPNMANSYNAATDDAAALAAKVVTDHFYTIFAYGTTVGAGYMSDLTEAAGAPAGNNYSASSTAELNDAFAEILESIELAGIGNVDLTDGTTSSVTTSTGTAHLLDVDTSSYKYYRAGGEDEDGNELYDSSANGGLGEVWEDAPGATFTDGAVKWDLGDNFILENGVTYTVTFDCWPSQDTLDHVASIKNDPTYYDSLDPAIKQYLDSNGNLKTNTTAKLNYTDTRTGESGSPEYVNPDPVTTTAVEQLAISKKWKNDLEDEWDKPESITLDVTRDGTNTYTATLSDDNDWKDSVYISIGIMRTTGEGASEEVELLTSGHNFTFDEPGAASGYKWELDVPVIRPMKINGTDTILVLADEDHPAPAGAKTYTLPDKDGVEGGTYYVSNLEELGLTATNERRSSINIRKAVDGEDAPEDATFPFTINVENALAPEAPPADDPNHNSDYWVWISVRDMSETDDPEEAPPVTDAVVSGATHAGNGWYYGVSGEDIVLNVKDGYSIRLNNLPADSKYIVTEGALADGFSFENGEIEIIDGSGTKTDSFVLDKPAQKVSGTIQETNTLYQVTMTNQYALTDIEVTKEWNDASDQDGIRPSVEDFAKLLTLSPAVEGKTPVVTDNGDNTYTIKYTGLPRFNNGEEVTYTVSEEAIDGYTTTGSPAEDHGTITNSHTPEVTEVTATKAWDDASDQDGKRPDDLTLTLNGAPEGTTVPAPTVTKNGNNWTYTWSGLPKYADGEEIAYTISENTVPAGYTKSPETPVASGGTITNSYTPEVTTVTATKVWSDANDQDGKRPESLTLTLNGLPEGATAPEPTVTKNGNSWTYTWSGLPKYAAGEEITYTVSEDTVPEGYTKSPETAVASGGTITNSYTPEVTEATVKKVWEDADNQDGIRPNSLEVTLSNGQKVTLSDSNDWTAKISGLPKYANGQEIDYTWTEGSMPAGYTLTNTEKEGTVTTLTNSYTPETTEATVKKVWDDASDQDGIRPDSLTVTLSNGQTVTLNEANGWEATISDLPKNKAGQPITYTWEEGTLPEGYTLTGAAVDGTVTTLTNKHTPEVITIEVEKIWEDADDQDGIRPDDVTVKLLADGVDTGKTVTLSESTEWKGKFENLPKNAAGEAIEYTVEEVVPEGYEDSYDDTGYIITNTHEPAVTEATVKKVWEDADDQDGKRPDDLTVTLSDGQTVTLSESNDWTATIEGLPKYNKGQEIVYSWTEGSLPDGYSLAGTSKDGTVTTLTNKHVPEVTSVTVKKVWDDADNRDGIRPSSVKITLLANGEEAGSATLSESNSWTYTWSGVDKYSKGEEIAYTVEEDDVADYEVEVTGTAAMGYTVKNYHQAAPDRVMSDPPVQKVVTGNPATDATFTFQMKALTDGAPMPEGSEDGVKTVQITGSGSYEFGEMWYDKAGEWVYEISEVNDGIEGYTYDDTVYTLTVKVEEVADGTQVKLVKTETVEGGDGTIVFTNKYEKKPEPAPKTGDDAMTTVALLALLASAVSIALIRKRRGAER